MLSGGSFMKTFDVFGIEPGRPERPFPLRPGTGIFKGISLDDEFPVTDETDFILMRSDNISWGHVASEILNVQVEGDFYGRKG
jgi:hypothetical protein